MEHFLSVFSFGSVLFFILTAAWVFAIFWCVEKEKPIGSGIWLIIYLCFLQFVVGVNFLNGVIHHPTIALLWVLGYFVLGFFWSFAKWWIFVHKKADKYREIRFNYLKERREGRTRHGVAVPELETLTMDTNVPESLQNGWREYLQHDVGRLFGEDFNSEVIPSVRKNKGKISMWIIYWPVSLIWSLINDFVKRVINAIVVKCRLLYGQITKGAFKNLDVPTRME